MINQELLLIPTPNHEQLALWKISSALSDSNKNIFLTHGTFSNKKVCLGIASFLAEKAYTCWIMEWRGHGNSSTPPKEFNFETIAELDISTVFTYLFEQERVKQLSCITHSGGGICLAIFLVKYPAYCLKVKSIAIFGCQAFGAATRWSNRTKILIGKYFSLLYGKLPAKAMGLGEHDESHFMMKQWYDWNLSGAFIGKDQLDYRKAVKAIRIPVLSICGQGDIFIAPVEGCRLFLEAFQNPQNRLLICGKEQGYLEDYNHSRVLHSRNAQQEIWPVVLKWIE